MIKKFMGLDPVELIILLCLLTALVNLLQYLGGREDGPPAAEGSIATGTLPTGSFDVIQRDGHLQPVDQKTGAVAGLLERRPNGEIQLTTADSIDEAALYYRGSDDWPAGRYTPGGSEL